MTTHTAPSLPRREAAPDTRTPGVIPFTFPSVPGVRCAFTTLITGNLALNRADSDTTQAAARETRASLMRDLGLESWSELMQVHGETVEIDPDPTPADRPSLLEADAHCTQRLGLALAIKTADCQPVLLTDAKGSAVAALHVGWRGNLLNLPGKGLAAFCRAFGLRPEEILAVRGPSLGPGAAEFVNFSKEWPESFTPWFNAERKTMDLWSLTREQLIRAGMRPEHLFSLDLCTKSLPEAFFSHRRGDAGRQMSLIWKTGDPCC